MNLLHFYSLYIPALEKALVNDNINYGYFVKDPSDYIACNPDELKEIEIFLDKSCGQNDFLDKVAYYFDAKSHSFPSIQGIEIETYKKDIEEEIIAIKKKYNL